jgi:hypothetical protein
LTQKEVAPLLDNGATLRHRNENRKQQMNGNSLSLGRNHTTADTVSMTDFGDCVRLDLKWNDGAYVYHLFDTKEEAVKQAARLGFYPRLKAAE